MNLSGLYLVFGLFLLAQSNAVFGLNRRASSSGENETELAQLMESVEGNNTEHVYSNF